MIKFWKQQQSKDRRQKGRRLISATRSDYAWAALGSDEWKSELFQYATRTRQEDHSDSYRITPIASPKAAVSHHQAPKSSPVSFGCAMRYIGMNDHTLEIMGQKLHFTGPFNLIKKIEIMPEIAKSYPLVVEPEAESSPNDCAIRGCE